VLTAFALCQRGVTCHLVPMNLKEREVWALAPDFVLLNYLRRGNEKFAAQMYQARIQFGLLDTEGGVWSDSNSYAELLWEDRNLLHKARCVCMWGSKLAGYVTDHGIFPADRVTVTGCPRFDFYHPIWRGVLGHESTMGMSSQDKSILINTNFSIINPRFKSAETNYELYNKVFGWSGSRISTICNLELEAIHAIIDMTRELARDYPHRTVVLRPHPFENPELYRTELSELDNVEIDTTGPVQPQIFRAAAVIQRSCTTAIEAGLASVPALSPQWIPAPLLMPVAEKVSVPCNSYADMKSQLDTILEGTYKPSQEVMGEVDTVVGDWFYRADGLNYSRVSDAILRSLAAERIVNENLCSKYLYGLNGSAHLDADYLQAILRYYLGLPPQWSFRRMHDMPSVRWTQTDKFFDLEQVRALANRIYKAAASRGDDVRPVGVRRYRDHDNLSRKYSGYSITMVGV
jgi:surface carbohydrate biosynthesis protein